MILDIIVPIPTVIETFVLFTLLCRNTFGKYQETKREFLKEKIKKKNTYNVHWVNHKINYIVARYI